MALLRPGAAAAAAAATASPTASASATGAHYAVCTGRAEATCAAAAIRCTDGSRIDPEPESGSFSRPISIAVGRNSDFMLAEAVQCSGNPASFRPTHSTVNNSRKTPNVPHSCQTLRSVG